MSTFEIHSSEGRSDLDDKLRIPIIQRYHDSNDDSKGNTRYGVGDCPDLKSFYDNDGVFRIVVESITGLELIPEPEQIQKLFLAIEKSNESSNC